MDFEEFTNKFLTWTIEKIEAKKFDGFPVCPYAKFARLNDKIQFLDGRDNVRLSLEKFDDQKYEIGVCWLGDDIDTDTVMPILNELSEKNPELLYFVSTPTSGFFAQNFTKCVFIQLKGDILEKRAALHKTSYYASWPAEYYQEITGQTLTSL